MDCYVSLGLGGGATGEDCDGRLIILLASLGWLLAPAFRIISGRKFLIMLLLVVTFSRGRYFPNFIALK